jgi:pimeloyl-ACP methyl ester carboxylesterase
MHIFPGNGYTLTWDEYSTGHETFLVIPGHANVRNVWDHILPTLAPLGRWVTLDLIGHYPSTLDMGTLPLHTTPAHLVALYAPAIRAIAAEQPVTLVGHSTGGLIALAIAAHMPQFVQRVIALSCVVWGQLTGFLGTMQWLLSHQREDVFRFSVQGILGGVPALVLGASLYAHHRSAFLRNPLTWETYRRAYPWTRQLDAHNLALVLRLLAQWDIRPLVTGLPLPVLVCTGVCDPIVPPAQSLWLAKHLPQANLYVFDHVGHVLYIEAAEELVQTITAWVVKQPIPKTRMQRAEE